MMFQTQDSEYTDEFVGMFQQKFEEKSAKLYDIEHGTN
jgi:hypothetical protein